MARQLTLPSAPSGQALRRVATNIITVAIWVGVVITAALKSNDRDTLEAVANKVLVPPIRVYAPEAKWDEHGDLIYSSGGSEHLKTCPEVQVDRYLIVNGKPAVPVEAVVISGTGSKIGDVLPDHRTIATVKGTVSPPAKLRIVVPPGIARSDVVALIARQAPVSDKPCEGDDPLVLSTQVDLYRASLRADDTP